MNPNIEAQNHALTLKIGQLDTELRNTQEQAQSRQQTIDYLTRALSSLLTEAGECPHSNPAELVTQIGTVMRRAPKPMTGIGNTDFERTESLISRRYSMMRNARDPVWSEIPYTIRVPVIRAVCAELNRPAPLTEEEAQRIAESVMQAADTDKDHVQTLREALLVRFGECGEIPPEVRKCHACGGSGSVGAEGHDRDGFPHEQPCPVCTLTFEEEAEIIASAPGTIAPGQRPISAPIDPDSGTRETVDWTPQVGERVRTAEKLDRTHDYRHTGYRRENACGVVIRASYSVRHPDGTEGSYDQDELQPPPEPLPPPAEMAVVLGNSDDAGPASEELDGE